MKKSHIKIVCFYKTYYLSLNDQSFCGNSKRLSSNVYLYNVIVSILQPFGKMKVCLLISNLFHILVIQMIECQNDKIYLYVYCLKQF